MDVLGDAVVGVSGPVGLRRGGTIPRTRAVREDGPLKLTREPALPDDSTHGRALVTRRAIADIVRSATLQAYGVTGFAGRVPPRGLRISLRGGLRITLRLNVAHGLPIAEVARQLDSSIRYAIRHALGREVDRLTIKVAHLEVHPGGAPPVQPGPRGLGPSDLADSGTDVA
jgi:uncharacterized alkaline shock family protein YloU